MMCCMISVQRHAWPFPMPCKQGLPEDHVSCCRLFKAADGLPRRTKENNTTTSNCMEEHQALVDLPLRQQRHANRRTSALLLTFGSLISLVSRSTRYTAGCWPSARASSTTYLTCMQKEEGWQHAMDSLQKRALRRRTHQQQHACRTCSRPFRRAVSSKLTVDNRIPCHRPPRCQSATASPGSNTSKAHPPLHTCTDHPHVVPAPQPHRCTCLVTLAEMALSLTAIVPPCYTHLRAGV